MKVSVCILGQVIVNGQVDLLDIDTTAKNIGSNADPLVEFFELLVAFNADGYVSI